ncbi:MAG: DUF1385 domain-containing protein [Fimbriimonadales bacterium]|nr:DUF1385 domain-containing protein [Fimbriimonadales bacterium]
MSTTRPTYWRYGGQAVIEGVMMRSPRYFAIACRKPDGELIVHTEAIEKTILGKLQFLNRPLLRGIFMLIDALALGIKALHFSSQVQIQNDPQIKPLSKPVQDIAIGASAAGGFAIGIALFFVLPTLLTDWLAREGWGSVARNLVDGTLRIAIFLLYVGLIGLLPDIRRVFQYHGAEHKAINALEEEGVVSLEVARAQSRLHPRCGTSFVLLVLIIGIFVFALLGRPPAYIRIPMHIALLPVVASLTYEVIRLAGMYKHGFLARVLLAPGLWTQYLTTREPTDDQIEVAVAALQAVRALEEGAAETVPEPAIAHSVSGSTS